MKKFYTNLLLVSTTLFTLISCSPEDFDDSICMSGDCDAVMIFPTKKDSNGFYHIPLDWTRDYYPYFAVDVEASEIKPQYRYNETSVVSAEFDSNLEWTIGEELVVPLTQYNPFQSNYSYSGAQFASTTFEKVLNFFKGVKVNIAQRTEIYFQKKNDGRFVTKRLLGPFPPQTKGDTITVFMEVFWDAGNNSVLKSHYKEKFIVE